ncbi:MAG TPA: arginine--tRNA ligase [Candidatus Saccharimonadales bacterium]|nr:arginine--tRNA ligase [Candidatus Saccharimonadales bacterium]
MKRELETALAGCVKELFNVTATVELTRPEEQFGDYATNVALQLAKEAGKPPREIAEALAEKAKEKLVGQVSEASVAGPGFLNLKLSDGALIEALATDPSRPLAGQTAVAEYSDPNPFKVLHAGHLYTSVVGDAIANLLEQAGATVHRVNFGGDVGLHVAKNMWAIIQTLGGEDPEKLDEIPKDQRAAWLSGRYVEGNRAYEEDPAAKAEIAEINKHVYGLHDSGDRESAFARIYWTCRQWSYDYFDEFYARIGSKFEKYYPESQTAPVGLQAVREHVGDVYQESDGAIIFRGEDYGLHTRVFINSGGLPTYETKDVGLIIKKWQDYKFDLSVVITGNDIIEYMKVVLKSIEQFQPELPERTRHLTHGIVKLAGGTKMSSRKGNFLGAADVLQAAADANKAITGSEQASEETSLGAVKYAFLKIRTGGDIIYDPEESVSLEGNSGPYLQYAHARARSVLRKAGQESRKLPEQPALEAGERTLVRKMGEYPEVADRAAAELMPHHVCTYLYELAQTFNRFYENNRVVGDPREELRLALVSHYADTLKAGLTLLGIASPEKM